ncbi:acetyl-CoA acetyltransferase [Mycobacteroides abscessus subsp. abscessus]|nr:acetyl-CoA acetyltransferase [Mycobacteroides abscessus subsp. abscessus]
MTTEAYIYEAIRTPRGRGKKNGSLHSVKPIDLTVGLIQELRSRFPNLDEDRISDVILGVVAPVGDQGADIARTVWKRSTSPPRRCAPASTTSSSPVVSSPCPACRWAPTVAPGRWTRPPTTTPTSCRRVSPPT